LQDAEAKIEELERERGVMQLREHDTQESSRIRVQEMQKNQDKLHHEIASLQQVLHCSIIIPTSLRAQLLLIRESAGFPAAEQ